MGVPVCLVTRMSASHCEGNECRFFLAWSVGASSARKPAQIPSAIPRECPTFLVHFLAFIQGCLSIFGPCAGWIDSCSRHFPVHGVGVQTCTDLLRTPLLCRYHLRLRCVVSAHEMTFLRPTMSKKKK